MDQNKKPKTSFGQLMSDVLEDGLKSKFPDLYVSEDWKNMDEKEKEVLQDHLFKLVYQTDQTTIRNKFNKTTKANKNKKQK